MGSEERLESLLDAAQRRETRWKRVALIFLALLLFITATTHYIQTGAGLHGQHRFIPFLDDDDFEDAAGPSKSAGSSNASAAIFRWDFPAASHLEYRPCYDGRLQCARLLLPMDYWNRSTDAPISLAVIRRPAAVPVTHPQYGGAIVLNPGGPGGKGVDFVKEFGDLISATVDIRETVGEGSRGGDDDEDAGLFYDLISFDPRGVGHSTPAIYCFQDRRLEQAWNLRALEQGTFDASDAALRSAWAMAQAKGQGCALPVDPNLPDIKKYATTASVARDVVELIELHGKWREQEARRLLPDSDVPTALAHRPGGEKLQYWGFSYGTFLGTTFAAMFPEKVQRMVLDGVLDAANYGSALWSNNLVDSEKAMGTFYHHCARVGYPQCALGNQTGETTTAGVQARVEKIMTTLRDNPLPIPGPNPELLSYSDIRNFVFLGLYAPIDTFPLMAGVLAGIEHGDGAAFRRVLELYHTFSCASTANHDDDDDDDDDDDSLLFSLSGDAEMVISCTDGSPQTHITRDEFETFTHELAAISPTLGNIWPQLRLHCIQYPGRALHRFAGPWEADTAHPLLFMGNTADPVTPLVHARRMADAFPGARVLAQDAAGHSTVSAFSRCTTQHVRSYFQTGELPPPDTVCAVDELPFDPPRAGAAAKAKPLGPLVKRFDSSRPRLAPRIAHGVHGVGWRSARGSREWWRGL